MRKRKWLGTGRWRCKAWRGCAHHFLLLPLHWWQHSMKQKIHPTCFAGCTLLSKVFAVWMYKSCFSWERRNWLFSAPSRERERQAELLYSKKKKKWKERVEYDEVGKLEGELLLLLQLNMESVAQALIIIIIIFVVMLSKIFSPAQTKKEPNWWAMWENQGV